MKNRTAVCLATLALCSAFLLAPAGARAQTKGTVVEEIVARVNNQHHHAIGLSEGRRRLTARSCAGLPKLLPDADSGLIG